MDRRMALGAIGVMATAIKTASAQESKPQPIAERVVGRRVRVYTSSLDSFFLGTVERVEDSLIFLKDVKVPLTDPPREALIDTRSVRLITFLGKDEK